MYDHASECRKGNFPAGPDVYRSLRYNRNDDGETFSVSIVDEKNDDTIYISSKLIKCEHTSISVILDKESNEQHQQLSSVIDNILPAGNKLP
jgi:hypothetical protein